MPNNEKSSTGDELPSLENLGADSTPTPSGAPAELPAASGKKRWYVGRPGMRPDIVTADTIEDAIRIFNADKTSYARKQLEIEEVPTPKA